MSSFLKTYLKVFSVLSIIALSIFLLFWGLTQLLGDNNGPFVAFIILVVSLISFLLTLVFENS